MTENLRLISKEIEIENNYFFLGLEEVSYLDEFKYASGETISDRINLLLKEVPGSKEARIKMAKNVAELGKRLEKINDEVGSFDLFLKEALKEVVLDAEIDPELKRKTEDFLASLEKTGQLFAHLDETGDSTTAFFDNVSEALSDDESEIGILKIRHADLMEFIARTHDLPKLLGGLNAQIDPDHEVIYREVICKYLLGKKFVTSKGKEIVFTEEDVEFVRQVAGKHEDIYREDQFAGQSKSLDKKNEVTDKVYIERSRCIFHFIDIFGKAVSFDESNKLAIVDQLAFKNRFIDLYQRHIKLPISPNYIDDVDWTKGKVNRAEWGLHGVTGLTWTFEGLENWEIKVDPNLIKEVQEGILEVLKKAKRSLKDALGSQQRYAPNETSKNNLRRNYRKVARVLAKLKSEIDS